ncbi:MAG TPA: hypothetical protein DHU96_08045 [Actinobacteria bacterium]|nr:hypothetical protein [Actinomycetota bacterium]
MTREYVCADCGAALPVTLGRWACDECGGPLDLRRAGLEWRHGLAGTRGWPGSCPALPCEEWALDRAWLGEVPTPLVEMPSGSAVWLKCDHLMPTGSFKDRGAVVLAALALELGASRIISDSSGNAAAAIAAHAARVRIPCEVFVPQRTSSRKVRQAQGYGAEVHLVPGGRAEAAAAAQWASRAEGVLYASHAANPHFHHGVKAWAYEVREQLGAAPDTVVVPVGSGSLLLGIAIGFRELLDSGSIAAMPRLVAVQSAGCAPLAGWPPAGTPPGPGAHPVAEGIAVPQPIRLRQLRQAVDRSSGTVVVVDDQQILHAHRDLARSGLCVEPTSAVAWAGWQALAAGDLPPGRSVIALTGSGLKTDPPESQIPQMPGKGLL